jgi:hypothetical protein
MPVANPVQNTVSRGDATAALVIGLFFLSFALFTILSEANFAERRTCAFPGSTVVHGASHGRFAALR